MQHVYTFSNKFINELLALILKDKDNGRNLIRKLDPSLFSLKHDTVIFSILKQQKTLGGLRHLKALIDLQFQLGKLDSSVVDAAMQRLDSTSKIDTPDLDLVLDITKKVLLRSSMGYAMENVISMYKDEDFDSMPGAIETALASVRELDFSIEMPMSKTLDSYVSDINARKSMSDRFPIGVYELDGRILGGISRGELGVVVAARKGGKSILLSHIAQTAVLKGLHVIYISFELLSDIVKHRITSGLLDIPVNDITYGGPALARIVRERLGALMSATGGDFAVKHAPGKSMTIEDIGVYISNYERICGRKVDMIIIDYADLVKPSKASGDYEALDDIYLNARNLGSPQKYAGIASGFNAAVWTASQVQRDALNKYLIGEGDIARCIGKIDHLDFLVAVCRTEQEEDDGVARLYVPVCRVIEGGASIGEIGPYSTDFPNGRIFNPAEASRFGDDEKCQIVRNPTPLIDPFTIG